MSGACPLHTQRRNGIYHLRVRVPDRLKVRIGMLEVRRSLHVYSTAQARLLAPKYAARVLEAFAVIERHLIPKEQARSLIHRCFVDLAQGVDRTAPLPSQMSDFAINCTTFAALERQVELHQQIDTASYDGSVKRSARAMATTVIDDPQRLEASSKHDLLLGAALALIEEQRYFLHRLDDRLAPFEPSDELFRGDGNAHAPTSVSASPGTANAIGPTLGEVVGAYLAAKHGAWARKTYEARVRHLSYLKEFFGEQTRVSALTPQDFVAYSEAVGRLRKAHHTGPVKSFAGRQTDDPTHRISGKTVTLIFESAKGCLIWAQKKKHMIGSNPAESVSPEVSTKKPKGERPRRPFTQVELETLFSSPLFTGHATRVQRNVPGPLIVSDAKYWVPIIGLYTGMRLGEIIQLHFNDVRLDAEIPFLRVTELDGGEVGSGDEKFVKSDAGVRCVPIHPDLIALGFAQFMARRKKQRQGKGRLFFDVKYGADGMPSTIFSKWFGRYLKGCGLTDKRLVFHSFRHTAKDALRDALLPPYVIDNILGHAEDEESGEYGQGASMKVLADAVEKMQLPVSLPELLKEFRPNPI